MGDTGSPMDDPAAELTENLDLDERATLLVESLSEPEARLLADSLAGARERSAQTLDTTIEGILAVVPRIVRGRVKKILVGR